MMKSPLCHILLILGMACQWTTAQTQPAYNIIFFGNSFTTGTGGDEAKAMNGVPGIVQQIALAAAHAEPRIQKSTQGGKNLEWHVENNLQTILKPDQIDPLPVGFQWDYVVMQDYSTGPTDVKMNNVNAGQPGKFLVYSQALFDKAKEHSPGVQGVLYMTWARHLDKEGFYPSPFTDPAEFQSQLRKYYHQAVANMNRITRQVTVAPAGDAWESLGFPEVLYAKDLHHASNLGSLLNGLVIYRTIYGGKTATLDLTSLCDALKISKKDCTRVVAAADAVDIDRNQSMDGTSQDPQDVSIEHDIRFGDTINHEGDKEALLLDMYTPSDAPQKDLPAILWIHGGGFRYGNDKSQRYIVEMAKRFARRGYVCVSINYRVREHPSDDKAGTLSDALEDAMKGLDWLRKNSVQLGLDPTRIVVGGGSAGGKLGANLCYKDANEHAPWDKSGIAAFVNLWGSPDASWSSFEIDENDPPTIIVHGTEDELVPYEDSILLCERLTAAGVKNKLIPIEGAGHTPAEHMDHFENDIAAFLSGILE